MTPTGKLPGAARLNLAIGLPLVDEAGLDAFLQQIYDPRNSSFHQYVTPGQFAQRFGPTAAQYEQVVAFAQRNHLTVMTRHSNRLLLDVSGSVGDIQRAFNITLQTYKHPREDRDFYAPDNEPSVEAELAVLDVSGLNNYVLPEPKSVQMDPTQSALQSFAGSGSGPGGAYRGNDFRAAYMPGVNLAGAGQTVGLLQFDGYYPGDIDAYETAAGLPHVPLQLVLLDGYDGTPTGGPKSGNPEVSLDIEMVVSMAPGLSKIVVFEAGPNGLQNDILSAMAANNQIKQFSCSWGWGGGPRGTTDNIFKQMAAQGQSFFSASGDSDAFPSGTADDPTQANSPSSSPYITVVGGTKLSTTGPGGGWVSETVWNRGNGVGSSGGISSHYALPTWQSGLSLGVAGGSGGFRNIPDVALVAENVSVSFGNGTNGTFGGTSCAAPLWGGLAALMNEQATASGKPAIGFINPAIYAIGKSSSSSSSFHDTTQGDNTWGSSPNAFYAVAGYDLCTGWGTPVGQGLFDALIGPSDSLGLFPADGFTATGAMGGPFSSDAGQFVLTNSGGAPLTWSLANTSTWVRADLVGGTLAPGATTAVSVELTAAAVQLAEGSYQANITFSNENSHFSQNAPFRLEVGQTLVANGGFESGDFSGWNLAGRTVVNNAPSGSTIYNEVEGDSSGYQTVHSGSYGAFLGDTQLATLSQSLSTIPGQSYLISFWLDNPTSGAGQHFQLNWNTNAASGNTIYDLSNPPVLGWTNLQFVVTASDTNTVLQFGAQNDPADFGLDDISVRAIPALGFSATKGLNGGLELSWLAGGGLNYQVQFRTNLLQGVWSNLGAPMTGSGGMKTITDASLTNGVTQRFYRLGITP